MTAEYRALPSVDRVLATPSVEELAGAFSREAVTDLVRTALEEARAAIAAGARAPSLEEVAAAVAQRARALWQPGPRPVINATGVIIHTNLGRAPLSHEALEAVQRAATGYSDLEYELVDGERGSRQQHVSHLLRQVTGAEAALVVNNNASAVLLGLATLAAGKEVIVSRGEAIEIGGGFRIPEVLSQSGSRLVEVGTTNRTHIQDYQRALTPETAALLKAHASNFRIVGFTHAPTMEDLVALGEKHRIPVLYDLGSGCLLPTEQFGLAHEPTVQEAVAAGMGLVFFSGDKLLGGPQAGIVVGKAALVERLARHPLARAVRIDKLSLAALSATLLHYVRDDAARTIPVWRMIAASPAMLRRRAQRWMKEIGHGSRVVKGESTVGGGSLPGETLPTWLLALSAEDVSGGPEELARRLRSGSPPVVARIVADQVALDPRTVLPEEEPLLLKAVEAALSSEH